MGLGAPSLRTTVCMLLSQGTAPTGSVGRVEGVVAVKQGEVISAHSSQAAGGEPEH